MNTITEPRKKYYVIQSEDWTWSSLNELRMSAVRCVFGQEPDQPHLIPWFMSSRLLCSFLFFSFFPRSGQHNKGNKNIYILFLSSSQHTRHWTQRSNLATRSSSSGRTAATKNRTNSKRIYWFILDWICHRCFRSPKWNATSAEPRLWR